MLDNFNNLGIMLWNEKYGKIICSSLMAMLGVKIAVLEVITNFLNLLLLYLHLMLCLFIMLVLYFTNINFLYMREIIENSLHVSRTSLVSQE